MAKLFTALFLIFTLLTLDLPAQTVKPAPQLGKNSVREVIAAMTVEEKVKLLVGMGMDLGIPGIEMVAPEDKAIPEKVPGAAGRTHAVPRLGIPSLTLADGPAGVRINPLRMGDSKTYYATAFPVATLLASSWDTELVRRVGEAFGGETRDFGVDILLAPGLNIHRNPLGGRNFEYYSEDPLVSGKMAAAFVTGVQSKGVGTSIKHLAANNQEFNRMQSNTIVGERALREIYLKGFEIAVRESNPWTIMSSYNLVNGTYTSQNPELLERIVRDEWGFKGFVMSDWFAGSDPVAQVRAGNDLIMPGAPAQTKAIIEAVQSGALDQKELDENVERVLNVILQSPSFKNYRYSSEPDLKAGARIAREAAAEGMVLLKNEKEALPFSAAASRRVALFGNTSYELVAGGTGSGDVNKAYSVSFEQGLAEAGFALDASLKETYARYIADQKAKRPPTLPFFPPAPIAEMPVETSLIGQQADAADAAIITIGRNSGEFLDRRVDGDFTLSATEQALIKDVSDAFRAKGKRVVVVLNVGGVIETASWRDRADAILLAWQPGQEGGNAITDVLTGRVNPSGKLATTFPVAYTDVPSAKTFPGKELVGVKPLIVNPFAGKPAEVRYEEGIYVGYRFYNTKNVQTAYEFGYGKSYTDFSYSGLKLSAKNFNGKITATVTVTNTGKRAGKEVVQLYVGAPSGKLEKPAVELRAFAKTKLLAPGEAQTLSFTLSGENLASFDPTASAWIAEAGTYTLKIGASVLDIRQSATFELKKEAVVKKVNKVLLPQVKI